MVLIIFPAFSFEGGKNLKVDLFPGRPVKGEVRISKVYKSYVTYKFRVPSNAFAVRISLENSISDLDLYIKKGEEINDYDYADACSVSDDYNEELFITRLSETPLEDGIYYIDVVYQRLTSPLIKNVEIKSIPFILNLEVITPDSDEYLVPGKSATAVLLPEKGMFKTFAVKVPKSTEALRIDLFNTVGDIDMFVNYAAPALKREDAEYVRESLLARESVVITRTSYRPLKTGKYYITLIDQIIYDKKEEVSISINFKIDPPEFLKKIPPFPFADNNLRNVLMATVEVIGEAGKGSGCILSSDGLILTNWHVIRGHSGLISPEIYIAVNLSDLFPPEELFKAEVVEYDEKRDFALLKIICGFYDQPLPYGYTFPCFAIGDADNLIIGQPLSFLGYPGIGGTGSKASISYTRGIISGFEETDIGVLIKTDGQITEGNSGGAAINAYFELIGLPTVISGEDSGQMGFIYPVNMVPEQWFQIVEEHNRNKKDIW